MFKNALLFGDIAIFNWEHAACKFDICNSEVYKTNMGGRKVQIELRMRMDASIMWCVIMDGFVLGKDDRYHYELMPSSRSDEFIANTRFGSKGSALLALIAHEKKWRGKDIKLTIE